MKSKYKVEFNNGTRESISAQARSEDRAIGQAVKLSERNGVDLSGAKVIEILADGTEEVVYQMPDGIGRHNVVEAARVIATNLEALARWIHFDRPFNRRDYKYEHTLDWINNPKVVMQNMRKLLDKPEES